MNRKKKIEREQNYIWFLGCTSCETFHFWNTYTQGLSANGGTWKEILETASKQEYLQKIPS